MREERLTLARQPLKSMCLKACSSSGFRKGCMSSRRAAWPSCPMSVTSPSGPIMARVDVTSFSRRGSMGGLVTCAKGGKKRT